MLAADRRADPQPVQHEHLPGGGVRAAMLQVVGQRRAHLVGQRQQRAVTGLAGRTRTTALRQSRSSSRSRATSPARSPSRAMHKMIARSRSPRGDDESSDAISCSNASAAPDGEPDRSGDAAPSAPRHPADRHVDPAARRNRKNDRSAVAAASTVLGRYRRVSRATNPTTSRARDLARPRPGHREHRPQERCARTWRSCAASPRTGRGSDADTHRRPRASPPASTDHEMPSAAPCLPNRSDTRSVAIMCSDDDRRRDATTPASTDRSPASRQPTAHNRGLSRIGVMCSCA